MKHQQNTSWAVSLQNNEVAILSENENKPTYQETFTSQTERAQSCLNIAKDIKARVNNTIAFESEFKSALNLKYEGLHCQSNGFFK